MGQPFGTFVGEVARVELLSTTKIQRRNGFRHLAVVVLHVELFGLEHTGLDTFFGEVFDERLVFGQSFVRPIEREEALVEFLWSLLVCPSLICCLASARYWVANLR